MSKTSRLLPCLLPLMLAACGGSQQEPATQRTVVAAQVSALAAPQDSSAARYHDMVQRFYLAYFGRPADVSGLDYWSEQYLGHAMPDDIAGFIEGYGLNPTVRAYVDSFDRSQESKDLYPNDYAVFVTAVYRNLFNREPEAVGLAYWVSALSRGAMTRPIAAFHIMRGAQGSDAELVAKKLAVAKRFTLALDSDIKRDAYDGMGAAAAARAMLATVTLETDPATFAGVDTTVAELLGKVGPAQRYLDFTYGIPHTYSYQYGMVPATGGAPVEMTPAGPKVGLARLVAASMQDDAVTSAPNDSFVYWSNKRLYRQPLLGHGNAPPRAAIVSSLTESEQCGLDRVFLDYKTPTKSVIVLRGPGPDHVCYNSDDGYLAVRMDMSNVTPPTILVRQPVFETHSPDGAITGFLLLEDKTIFRTDPAFTGQTPMFTMFSKSFQWALPETRQVGNMFFQRDAYTSAWDADATTPGVPLAMEPTSDWGTLANLIGLDRQNTYYTYSKPGQVKVVKLPLATKVPVEVGVLPMEAQQPILMKITANYFVLSELHTGDVWVLPRAGGSARRIFNPVNKFYSEVLHVAGERVWFETAGGLSSIATDGNGLKTIPKGVRVGCVYSTNYLLRTENDHCTSMLVLEDETTLRGYNAFSGELEVTYGTIAISSTRFPDVVANRGRGSDGQGMIFQRIETSIVNGQFNNAENWHFVAGKPGLTRVAVQ